MWSALNIPAYGGYMPAPSGYISAHRICDPLDGKSKEVISSSQSQSLVEWVFVAKTSCCCCLSEAAVVSRRSGPAGHQLGFSATSFALLHSDAARNWEWFILSGDGRELQEELCSGGNWRGWLGEEWLQLHRLNSFWQRESEPLAVPPGPPCTVQKGYSCRFCYNKKWICISL